MKPCLVQPIHRLIKLLVYRGGCDMKQRAKVNDVT